MTENLRDLTIHAMTEALASKSPTPGGGAVAALLAALGAATALMTLNYSIGRASLAVHDELHAGARDRLEALRLAALTTADLDAQAYAALNALWKLNENDPARLAGLPAAVRQAISVPIRVMNDAVDLLRLLRQLCGATNHRLNSDLAIAAICAEAAVRAAGWNVRINLPSIDDADHAGSIRDEFNRLLNQANELLGCVISHCDRVQAQLQA
jgi:formiminotetrahydrofolate cyclodeaminase